MTDVMPFLENVLSGRNVPPERRRDVARHYEIFGGVSPINEENRKLIAALERELEINGPHLPVYFGNRNWQPFLPDTIRKMRDDGVKHALAFVTAAYSSYSSCRQYLENIADAQKLVGDGAPNIEKLRAFYNHPLFIEANVSNVRAALEQIPEARRFQTQIVFTAHSIPESMARNCNYEAQLQEASRLVFEGVSGGASPLLSDDRDDGETWVPRRHKLSSYKLVFQSRSGSPSQPWLGPDVCDQLRGLHASGATDVIVSPIGFVSDHMEIVYDLDTEAMELCRELGLNMVRASTASTQPAFVKMIRELVLERLEPGREKRFLGATEPAKDACTSVCCMMR
jgi:ferrochelatase